MRRDWTAARAKVAEERICRVCALGEYIITSVPLDAAHIIPRSRVKPGPGEDPRNVVPLCRLCHAAYDECRLDLLPFLSLEEQAFAVGLVGMHEAYRRVTNQRVIA